MSNHKIEKLVDKKISNRFIDEVKNNPNKKNIAAVIQRAIEKNIYTDGIKFSKKASMMLAEMAAKRIVKYSDNKKDKLSNMYLAVEKIPEIEDLLKQEGFESNITYKPLKKLTSWRKFCGIEPYC